MKFPTTLNSCSVHPSEAWERHVLEVITPWGRSRPDTLTQNRNARRFWLFYVKTTRVNIETPIGKPGADWLWGTVLIQEGENGAKIVDEGEAKRGNEGERGRKCRCIYNLLHNEMKWSHNCLLLAWSGIEFQPKGAQRVFPVWRPFPMKSTFMSRLRFPNQPGVGDLHHPCATEYLLLPHAKDEWHPLWCWFLPVAVNVCTEEGPGPNSSHFLLVFQHF